MTIIDKKKIKAALGEAKKKLRNHQNGPLSEAYIEAKACIDCFEYVLEHCKDVDDNDKCNDDGNEQATDELELVGTLNKPFGLKGYNTAEVGTVVYGKKDRYIIKLSNDKETIEVPFYREALAPNINFYYGWIMQVYIRETKLHKST